MKFFEKPNLLQNTNQWAMAQVWQNLLFANWPYSPDEVQKNLPKGLEVDTYNGEAWLSIVPFQLSFSPYPLHSLPFSINFNELNLRTYVRSKGQLGVYFFCLDATDWFSVEVARKLFHLNYFNAQSQMVKTNNRFGFNSQRVDKRGNPAVFECEYEPTSEVFHSAPNSLESFLTDRYCFFSEDRQGQIHQANIYHNPWPLQQAMVKIQSNKLFQAHGFNQPTTEPLCLFSEKISVVNWWLNQPITKSNVIA